MCRCILNFLLNKMKMMCFRELRSIVIKPLSNSIVLIVKESTRIISPLDLIPDGDSSQHLLGMHDRSAAEEKALSVGE